MESKIVNEVVDMLEAKHLESMEEIERKHGEINVI